MDDIQKQQLIVKLAPNFNSFHSLAHFLYVGNT
jgi:hypothetical protein